MARELKELLLLVITYIDESEEGESFGLSLVTHEMYKKGIISRNEEAIIDYQCNEQIKRLYNMEIEDDEGENAIDVELLIYSKLSAKTDILYRMEFLEHFIKEIEEQEEFLDEEE